MLASETEPHHIPHGYTHPKEHHHWWWYAGFVVAAIAMAIVLTAYLQFDRAEAPLCQRLSGESMTSPDGAMELSIMRVSCMGGAATDRVILHRTGGLGGSHTVMSFEGEGRIRGTWVSGREIMIRKRGGRMASFAPEWSGVHVRYR